MVVSQVGVGRVPFCWCLRLNNSGGSVVHLGLQLFLSLHGRKHAALGVKVEDVIRNLVSALVGGVAPVILGFPDSVNEVADSLGGNESLCLEEVGVQSIEVSSGAKSEHKGGVLVHDLGLAGSEEQVSIRGVELLIDSGAVLVNASNVSVDIEVSGQQNQLALGEGSLGLDEVDGGGYLGHPDVEGHEELLLGGVVLYTFKLGVEEVEGLVQSELYLCILNTNWI